MMTRSESYARYSKSIQEIKRECLNSGMSEDEFKNIYFDSLISLEKEKRRMLGRILDLLKTHKLLLLFMMFVLLSCYYFHYIYSSIVCNIQDYIYGGLKLFRIIFIPILSLLPSQYYHETCLIQNPFFTVTDMDCWPCSTVHNVREVENPQSVTNQYTPPFVYKTDQNRVTVDDLHLMYFKYFMSFEMDTEMVLMDNEEYLVPFDMFNHHNIGLKSFYVWKFHKATEAIILRKLIKRPIVVPKFSQSLERYLIIDASNRSYRLPDTECSFAFLISLSGSRKIQLTPAEECVLECKSLQVELKEKHLLWYNWWYWKPIMLAATQNSTFIGHLGSYCQLPLNTKEIN